MADEIPPQRYTAALANEIEHKWQDRWDDQHVFDTPNRTGLLSEDPRGISSRPHMFVLDMFPYPSGVGLHVGHPLGYIATDVYARFQRMNGFNVLHAMGYDAFGLPAEQYAVQTGTHPRVTTEENIATMKRQLRALGLGHDPRRGPATTDVTYYRWTQWIFLQIYNSWYDEESGRAREIGTLVQEFRAGRFDTPGGVPFDELDSLEQRKLVDSYRLAYEAYAPVNWCPGLGTVLANEEVTGDGRSERGNFPVYRRPLKQWMLRITAYADRLLDDLDELDWTDSIKLMQRNWIGRSTGASVVFGVENHSDVGIEVFTTRPDTLFGATYMVLAPEHPLVDVITANQWPDDDLGNDFASNELDAWKGLFGATDAPPVAVNRYRDFAAAKTDLERQSEGKEKTGVFIGAFAINPTNNARIPIFIADYVLMGYGTGAIMAVPAHDERDFEFAREFELPIVPVIRPDDEWLAERDVGPDDASNWPESYVGDGVGQNSANDQVSLDGLHVEDAKRVITEWLEQSGRGKPTITYKLRDWLFSRQRYWGEPFPIVYDDAGPIALPEEMLPVVLPEVTDFEPVTSDDPDAVPEPPLARAADWLEVDLDLAGPEWAGYGAGPRTYTRDEHDAAVGGFVLVLPALPRPHERRRRGRSRGRTELGRGHPQRRFAEGGPRRPLRRWGRARGVAPLVRALLAQGVVRPRSRVDDRTVPTLGEPGLHPRARVRRRAGRVRGGRAGRSARREVLLRRQGSDPRVRQDGQEPAQRGRARRHLPRLRRRHAAALRDVHGSARQGATVEHGRHRRRAPVPATVVAQLRGRGDRRVARHGRARRRRDAPVVAQDDRRGPHRHGRAELQHRDRAAVRAEQPPDHAGAGWGVAAARVAEPLALMVAPLAPHIAEELWARLGHDDTLTYESFPDADPQWLVEERVEVPVQINGKVRARIEVAADADAAAHEAAARAEPRIAELLDGATVRNLKVVPGKIVNFVIA